MIEAAKYLHNELMLEIKFGPIWPSSAKPSPCCCARPYPPDYFNASPGVSRVRMVMVAAHGVSGSENSSWPAVVKALTEKRSRHLVVSCPLKQHGQDPNRRMQRVQGEVDDVGGSGTLELQWRLADEKLVAARTRAGSRRTMGYAWLIGIPSSSYQMRLLIDSLLSTWL